LIPFFGGRYGEATVTLLHVVPPQPQSRRHDAASSHLRSNEPTDFIAHSVLALRLVRGCTGLVDILSSRGRVVLLDELFLRNLAVAGPQGVRRLVGVAVDDRDLLRIEPGPCRTGRICRSADRRLRTPSDRPEPLQGAPDGRSPLDTRESQSGLSIQRVALPQPSQAARRLRSQRATNRRRDRGAAPGRLGRRRVGQSHLAETV
jgi:hypothetical protein